ncbi:pitrilysin family protein [uncultured Litoreibacter sp.]|uniref:M16 family metallopeptidase n=1 Tax=uncultured Litoreibacter sp. TaxID=1392394 RepID=UPI002617B985|nr:pitrilysin family protein [uncultured Litoreibacter sp.]
MIRFLLAALAVLTISLPARAIEIQEVTSPGGIKAWLVEEHSIPFTALEIRFKGGASLDRDGKRGAIHLMAGLIEEGTGELDSTAFAAAREALAASYDFDVYDDSFTISAQFLTENQPEALALLRSAVVEPRFDQPSIDRVRGQVVSIIKSDEKDPSAIARRAFTKQAFGDHPYGSPKEGTIESLNALTRDDIVAAHQDVFARDRLFVGAVGDITAEQLGVVLDDLLGDLPATGAPLPQKAEIGLTGAQTVVPFDVPQSTAIFGHEGIDRHDPDFFPAYVMNQVLGAGGFGSRLMEEVREKRGLTYGVSSFLVPKDHGYLIMGQVASSNDRIAEAIDVIRDEWAKMAADGVTEEELADAKKYLTGAYPLRFDGNSTIAGILVGMQMDDLPIDYVNTRNDKVNAVTLDDIKRVAARLLKPDALQFVVVGQPEGFESTN